MIGILLYIIAFRLEIMQEIGLVSIFQACPDESHVIAINRVLKYL